MNAEKTPFGEVTSVVQRVEGTSRLLRDLASVPFAVAIVRGRNLRYEFANEAWRTLLGWEEGADSTVGFSSIDLENRAETTERVASVFDTGVAVRIDAIDLYLKDGRTRGIALDVTPLYGDDGKIDGILITARDISREQKHERKVADRIREAEARLVLMATALKVEPLVVVGVDERGNILVCEGGAATTMIPQVGENIFASHDGNPIAEGLRDALAFQEGDKALVLGERRYIASFRRGSEGKHEGAACLGMDVTAAFEHQAAATEMQSKLLQMQKLESLGVLAGGIAHDFNNLLTAIIGNATLAQLELPEDSSVRATLQDILLTSRRAATLSRQMLAYSGKGHFEVKHVDLSQQVKEIAHLLEATIPKKVEVKLELSEDALVVEVDVAQLQQIVMNLVINAAEAIGSRPGIVTVRTGDQEVLEPPNDAFVDPNTFAPGRYVFVEVKDNGIGMSDETRAKVFDPFFTTKFSGRGLGLAAVLGAVRGHRGLIHLESTLGEGSTFRALLPASDQPVERIRSQPPVGFQGSGVILIVDDESVVRSAARRILQRMGFATLEATNGREAVEVFAAHADDISAVILDMTMPEMSGDEALRQMRALDPEAVVLVSSGYNDVEANFSDSPPNGFLLKPYTPAELSERLRKAIRIRDEG